MILQKQPVPAQISNSIAKLNQLLRLYQVVKKTDKTQKQIIKVKAQKIMSIIKNYQYYDKIEKRLERAIELALEDPKNQTPIVRYSSSSQINNSVQSSKQSLQKIRQGPIVSDASISNNNIKSSQKSAQKIQVKQLNMKSQQKSIQFITPPHSSSDFSNQKSEQSCCSNLLLQNFQTFCNNLRDNVVESFVLNQDLFIQLEQLKQLNYIFLCGVKNPQSSKVKQLNICTLMNFSKQEIFQPNIKNKFNKQIKQFQNNIRSPLGIVILGNGIQDLTIQHIRFLEQIKTPVPLMFIIKDLQTKDGQVYHFSKATVNRVKNANTVQYLSLIQEIKKQYKQKKIKLTKFQILNDKQTITKPLLRKIASPIQTAPNAISIQSSNECIKEELIDFSYKFYTKFYVNTKADWQVYIQQNNIIKYKYSFKLAEFETFKQLILKQDSPLKDKRFFMSTSISKQSTQINKQFLKLLLESKTRQPFFFINFTGLKDKKVFILLLNNDVTFKDIEQHEGILLKNIQKQVKILTTAITITKTNYKPYQFTTEQKIQGIQLKYK